MWEEMTAGSSKRLHIGDNDSTTGTFFAHHTCTHWTHRWVTPATTHHLHGSLWSSRYSSREIFIIYILIYKHMWNWANRAQLRVVGVNSQGGSMEVNVSRWNRQGLCMCSHVHEGRCTKHKLSHKGSVSCGGCAIIVGEGQGRLM